MSKANYRIEMKAKGLFGAGAYIVVSGSASNTRYSNTQNLQFIIHFDDARTEPSTLYSLVPLTINKKNNNNQREYMVKSQGLGHAETNSTQVSTTAKKIGEGLYLIKFAGEIPLGEFAITIEKTKQGYDFGIDANTNPASQTATPNTTTTQPAVKANTQAATIYPEPDFDNLVYHLNTTDNSLVDLERAINAKSEGAFGFLNLNSSISIAGKTSSIKLTADDKNTFVVRLANAADPYTVVELVPCIVNEEKQTRDYSPSAKKDQTPITAIPLKFKRINGNNYLISPLTPLPKGLYFFINKAIKEKSIFAFEVI